jgi:hypothetical protein
MPREWWEHEVTEQDPHSDHDHEHDHDQHQLHDSSDSPAWHTDETT